MCHCRANVPFHVGNCKDQRIHFQSHLGAISCYEGFRIERCNDLAMEARHPKETRFFCFVMRASTELKGAIIWPWRPDTPNRQGSLVLELAQAWPQVLIKTWALEPTIFINCWVLSGPLVVSLAVEVGVMGGCWCHLQPLSYVPLQSQCVIPCRQLQRPKNTFPKPLGSHLLL